MVALLVTSLFAFAPTTKPAYAPHAFDTAINLSNNTNESLWSQVAASGNSAYVVWQDFGRVFFRRSTDSGGTFGSTLDLGAVSGSKNVQVAASGNSAYVAWSNSSGVFFRRSIDNGGNFDATINLGCCHFGFEVGLAASGSSVYVAWHDGGEVYLRASTDNGAGFGITINVSNTPSGGTDSMRIAASGNSVYAAWSDSTIGNRDIFFNRSTDNGATFGTATNLSNTPGRSGCCGSTGIAASGNSVYVRWDEEDAGRVFFRASTDSGATFGGVIDVGDASGTSFRLMAASGSNVYLVFLDDTLGNVEVFFRRSTDSGGSFDSPLNLSNNSGGSGAQAVDASGSTVYVIWVDVTSGNQVLVRGSTDSGATFANAVTFNLTANPFTPFQARIAVAGRAYAVWDDTLTPFNQDIFFSRSASHNPPVANAGPDQTVNEEKFVTLDGRGSFDPDGDPMTFSWTQTAGPTVTLVNPNTARPAFNAPLVNTQTILTFQLVVNDGTSNSIPDTVNITVNPVFNFITGRFNKSTAPAPASQTISGLGFQPKALILFSDGSAVNGIQEHYNFAIGFSDGTNSRSLVLHSDDNSILSQAGRAGGTRVLRLLSNGNPTVSAEATLTSFNADGFTLNWVTNDASATKIHYIALGGSNLTNVRVNHFLANTVAGNQNVTGIGFQPDFLMFINPRTTNAGNWQAVHAFAGLGFAKSATEEGAIAVLSEDLSDPMDTYRWQKADRSILTLTPCSGAIEAVAELVSMISDGFR
ncbi:MAG: PKD domain-containing protein, partial [Nitrososphaerales archaeon]